MATGWCKSLVAKGLQGELLELSSSVRASLGKSVESMIRTVQVLNAYHLEEERRPAIFLEGAYTETTVMKDGILAFHDVCSAVLENLPSMDPALKILRGNVIATIARTAQLLDDSKKGVQLFYGDASKIQDAMKAGDEIEELVKKTANPKTVEKCIEGEEIFFYTLIITVPGQGVADPNFKQSQGLKRLPPSFFVLNQTTAPEA